MTRARTAIVLAAGQGERMRPLTTRIPKPLVRLAGRPLIDHVLDRLTRAGVDKVVVNVHYLADQIEAHLSPRQGTRPEIVISDERDLLLDTGGGANKALPKLGPGPFFIHNADSVWSDSVQAALPEMLRQWDKERMDCLLLLAPLTSSLGYSGKGDFAITPDGRLSRRGERQVVPFAFAGVSLCDERLFKDAPQGPFSLNLLWDRSLKAGRLYGIRLDGRWMHVGTPEALAEAENWFERERA
jgi:N-acetyl-alpha-D-muramate 1-phosphate uridylyltransferase